MSNYLFETSRIVDISFDLKGAKLGTSSPRSAVVDKAAKTFSSTLRSEIKKLAKGK